MSDHDHDHHDHDGHGHDHHQLSWADELAQLREGARHFYMHQFDWKGQEPPPGFDGPRFFAPAEAWRIEAHLDRSAPGAGQPVELATSSGQLRNMTVAGQLVFSMDGAEHRLTGFITHGADGFEVLFIPFRDATSGAETYGAGRYLEVAYPLDEEIVELDFNYAYNPSCVYSPAYDCPYPPPGNRLALAVRAGEMMPAVSSEH